MKQRTSGYIPPAPPLAKDEVWLTDKDITSALNAIPKTKGHTILPPMSGHQNDIFANTGALQTALDSGHKVHFAFNPVSAGADPSKEQGQHWTYVKIEPGKNGIYQVTHTDSISRANDTAREVPKSLETLIMGMAPDGVGVHFQQKTGPAQKDGYECADHVVSTIQSAIDPTHDHAALVKQGPEALRRNTRQLIETTKAGDKALQQREQKQVDELYKRVAGELNVDPEKLKAAHEEIKALDKGQRVLLQQRGSEAGDTLKATLVKQRSNALSEHAVELGMAKSNGSDNEKLVPNQPKTDQDKAVEAAAGRLGEALTKVSNSLKIIQGEKQGIELDIRQGAYENRQKSQAPANPSATQPLSRLQQRRPKTLAIDSSTHKPFSNSAAPASSVKTDKPATPSKPVDQQSQLSGAAVDTHAAATAELIANLEKARQEALRSHGPSKQQQDEQQRKQQQSATPDPNQLPPARPLSPQMAKQDQDDSLSVSISSSSQTAKRQDSPSPKASASSLTATEKELFKDIDKTAQHLISEHKGNKDSLAALKNTVLEEALNLKASIIRARDPQQMSSSTTPKPDATPRKPGSQTVVSLG